VLMLSCRPKLEGLLRDAAGFSPKLSSRRYLLGVYAENGLDAN